MKNLTLGRYNRAWSRRAARVRDGVTALRRSIDATFAAASNTLTVRQKMALAEADVALEMAAIELDRAINRITPLQETQR